MKLGAKVLLVLIWSQTVLLTDVDHTHGTSFVFLAPFCNDFHAVNVVVRWKYGARFRTVVTIRGTYKKFILSQGEEFPYTRLPCKRLVMGSITYSGAIVATTIEPIMLYVQYEQDNFMVYPVPSLSKHFTILTYLPESMDTTFFGITTLSKTNLKIKLPGYLKTFVTFLEDRFYPGEIISTSLGRCDVLMISCECDLSGVVVESEVGVMVVSGSYQSTSETNTLIQEVFPSGAWGKNVLLPIESWMNNVTLKVLGTNYSIQDLQIVTENSTEHFPSVDGMFNYSVHAKEHVFLYSDSPIYVVFKIDIMDLYQNEPAPILTTGIPLEQYPKFLCDSFSSPPASTCFAGMGNSTRFQSMFYQQVVEPSDQWFFVIVKKNGGGLVTIPDYKHVWSYTPRLLEEDSTRVLYTGAHRVSSLYNYCTPDMSRHIKVNDGADNDCDGTVDEEFRDSADNDDDKHTDEDTSSDNVVCVIDYNYGVQEKTWILLSNPMIAILISILVAVVGVGVFIGGSALIEILKGGHPTRSSRVEPME